MSHQMVVGNLVFDLRRSAARKTVGITIERNGSLALFVPNDFPMVRVESVVQGRRLWIYTKLAEKALLLQPCAPREYISGETFYYLGRGFRLTVTKKGCASSPPLRFQDGRFYLKTDERKRAEKHFVDWYVEHGTPWLEKRIGLYSNRIESWPKAVEVREVGFRWGSCTPGGKIRFHWRTLQLPPRIIDYIIVHELVHFHYPHHTPEFWKKLERAMPDYDRRRQWLAVNGAS